MTERACPFCTPDDATLAEKHDHHVIEHIRLTENDAAELLFETSELGDGVMETLELPYFVVGAMARDVLLAHFFGLATSLATRNLDIGVAVRGRDEHEAVATKLVRGKVRPGLKDSAPR
ncbi:MAG: hypothetical protein BMS9Abin37_2107 [Acidobacteriota bacterium]|nr:MAG: hypothetical protein BMS9Abin37_2107 [Acidobacteriota bacterium]